MKLFGFIFLILTLTNSIYSNQADSALVEYSKGLKKHENFKANFIQKRHISIFPAPLESEGTISFSSPDNIRFDYSKPFISYIIFSDGKMARYRIENGIPVKQHSMEIVAKAITREVMRFIKGEFSNEMPYEIKYDSNKPGEFTLIPVNSQAKAIFSSMVLIFAEDKSYIKTIKLFEKSGDNIIIEHNKPDFSPISKEIYKID